jgi:branched-chain amino acid transport system substrate-binding protein
MVSASKNLAAALFMATAFVAPPSSAAAAEATIKLGNTAPYSGPASAYGTIARAEAAYFQMLNDQGGVNGRRIEFLTLDDGYSPAKTVEQTRKLVEQDEVLAMFSSVGTAPNISVQKYLNARHVPQVFVSSGATRWNDPEHFPWTVGFNPTYELEGRLYAEYILKTKPDAKIAVIAPNEDAGKDYVRGFKEGLGEHINQLVSETTYLTADPTIDSQMVTMRESGADVFFAEATPKFAAQAIKKAASMGWKPLIILPTVSNSFSAVLEPAGLENSVGVVTGLYLKDPNDARWGSDPALKDWFAWMKQY